MHSPGEFYLWLGYHGNIPVSDDERYWLWQETLLVDLLKASSAGICLRTLLQTCLGHVWLKYLMIGPTDSSFIREQGLAGPTYEA